MIWLNLKYVFSHPQKWSEFWHFEKLWILALVEIFGFEVYHEYIIEYVEAVEHNNWTFEVHFDAFSVVQTVWGILYQCCFTTHIPVSGPLSGTWKNRSVIFLLCLPLPWKSATAMMTSEDRWFAILFASFVPYLHLSLRCLGQIPTFPPFLL